MYVLCISGRRVDPIFDPSILIGPTDVHFKDSERQGRDTATKDLCDLVLQQYQLPNHSRTQEKHHLSANAAAVLPASWSDEGTGPSNQPWSNVLGGLYGLQCGAIAGRSGVVYALAGSAA